MVGIEAGINIFKGSPRREFCGIDKLFPLIYPPHLLVLPATFELHLFWQTYPHFRALYVIPVRRTKGLPTASFRSHLTMDTLAVQLYTSLLPRRIRDFHPLERAHGTQIRTTSLAGGLLCGYKPVILAGSKEPRRFAICIRPQAYPKGLPFLCLYYRLTRKRVYVFFQ